MDIQYILTKSIKRLARQKIYQQTHSCGTKIRYAEIRFDSSLEIITPSLR